MDIQIKIIFQCLDLFNKKCHLLLLWYLSHGGANCTNKNTSGTAHFCVCYNWESILHLNIFLFLFQMQSFQRMKGLHRIL